VLLNYERKPGALWFGQLPFWFRSRLEIALFAIEFKDRGISETKRTNDGFFGGTTSNLFPQIKVAGASAMP
jgi:hypothetical protein